MAETETADDKLRGQRGVSAITRTYLFVVLEGARPLAGGARFVLDAIDEIVVGRGSERRAAVETRDGVRRLVLSLDSPSMSRVHARLRRSAGAWRLEDAHSRNGCYLNGERVARAAVEQDDIVETGHAFLMVRAVAQRAEEPVEDLDATAVEREPVAFRTLVPALAARLTALRRFASSDVALLLSGETGTGKEVLARAIHELSGRRGPFVAVNCSTLTDGLAESQLFGHVRGAFSGAVGDAVGFVRAAEGGTLLLDEVGDLSGSAQGALLRVLQEREVVPVGRARPQAVDVRFVATTPRPLDAAVGSDLFRSDLFARLSGFVHPMTPLRDRREDIGLLAAALLRKAGARDGDRLRIAPEMGLDLLRHTWPLNVRELEQVLVRARLLAENGVMNSAVGAAPAPEGGSPRAAPSLTAADREVHARVSDVLAATRGNISEAARTLGKGRIQLHRLLRRLKIDPKQFRA